MRSWIHPTAVIDSQAIIGCDVSVGPYCVIGPEVSLGDRVQLKSHVVIEGRTQVGADTVIFPFVSLGQVPQDKKFQGERTTLEIGTHNVIREHVTMNPGTEGGGGRTRVGHHGLFMVGVHIAHDCHVGDHVVFANQATLAGHVSVGNYTVIGGLSAIHQFVRVGEYAMIGGMSGVEQDVIPYGVIVGERGRLNGLNLVGLKRNHFSSETIQTLRNAYKCLFEKKTETSLLPLRDRLTEMVDAYSHVPEVMRMIDFIETQSKRSLCLPK